MKRLTLVPDGWPCLIADCPPGLFLSEGKWVCMKSEYKTDAGKIEAYCDSGEFYCGDPQRLIQPLIAKWEEHE